MNHAALTKLPDFNLFILRALLDDIPETRFHERIGGVGHSPAWIVGHLAITQDFVLKMMGQAMLCSEQWLKQFGPGQPEGDTSHFTKAELFSAVERGHKAVAKALETVDVERLDTPHSVVFLKTSPLATVRDLVMHLMITHEAFHAGQLSAWRRQAGFPALL